MTTIRVEGAEELIARLTRLEQMQRVKDAIYAATMDIKGRIAKYPDRSSRPNLMLRGNSARAQRMRAGFFARLKSGEIEVPYRRGQSPGSEKLGQRWAVSMENAGWRGVVGNNASYAKLVQDSANQTSYHRHTGWVTTNQVAQLYGKQAIDSISRALIQEVENG